MIDNYDSFTFNLVQALGSLANRGIRVFRNDAIDVAGLAALKPTHLVISPGPRTPAASGISGDCVRYFAGRIPVLGVCLGHQCVAEVFGGRVVRAARLMHGKTSRILHDGRGVFAGVENPFVAARYHSLIVEPSTVPVELEITARVLGREDEIMGLRHRGMAVEAVQFHPESFLTPQGPKLLANFLRFG